MADMTLYVYGSDIDKFLSTASEHFHNEDNWLTVEEREKEFENFRDKVSSDEGIIYIDINFDDTQYLIAIFETLQYVDFSSAVAFSYNFSHIMFNEPLDFLTFISDFVYNYNDVFGEYEFGFIMEYLKENGQLPELGLNIMKKSSLGSTESYIYS